MSSSCSSPPAAPNPGHTGANTRYRSASAASVGSPAKWPPKPWNATTAAADSGPETNTSHVIPRAVVIVRTSDRVSAGLVVIRRVCQPPVQVGDVDACSAPDPSAVRGPVERQ